MNVLVIGSGGRESALAWAVKKSPRVNKVYIAPGNGGTARYGENIDIEIIYPYVELLQFVEDAEIDLTIVGPEQPLVDGIVDVFNKTKNAIFGPSKKAARLEGSKVFMKEFMSKHGIPTAKFKIFNSANEAVDYVESQNKPFVVKTNGLAAGKGAIVNTNVKETLIAINRLLVDREFGAAGDTIILEDLLEGIEISVFIITDGNDFKWLATAQDHKRIFDNDEGPNTGGMGAYAPAPFVDDRLRDVIATNIILPTLEGMKKEGCPYTGVLYIGLMLTKSGPIVVEYNIRFGDPEAQVVLPLLKTDLVKIIGASLDGKLNSLVIEHYKGYCAGIVMAASGYPGTYTKGVKITGDIKEDTLGIVFHAGTKYGADGNYYTNGGRALCVSALGATLQESIDRAYEKAGRIDFEGAYYRKDIGKKGLKFFEGINRDENE